MSEQQRDWRQVKIGELLAEHSERSVSSNQHEVLSVTKDGIFSQREYFKKQIASEDNSGYKVVRKGDVVFSAMNLWMGSVDVVKDQEIGIVSPAYITMRPTEGLIDTGFLGYFLRGDEMRKKYVQHSQQGASIVRRNLNKDDLLDDEVCIPPLPEQKKIAEILSGIEKAIDRASTLLQKEKFVLHAALNEQIEAIDDRYRKTAGNMLEERFLTALKDGNHGEQYPKKSEFTQTGVPYLSASAISEDGDVDLTSCPCLPPERSCLMRIPPAEGGDVILTHNASIGKVAIIPENAGAVIASTSTTYYRTNKEVLMREFLAATMMSDFYQNQLKRIMGQTTRNQVPITAQRELVLIAPPMDAQGRISRIYNYHRTIRLGRIAQIKGLQLLKSSLSSDLLSGRKRVSV